MLVPFPRASGSSLETDYPVGAGVPITSPQLYSAGHTDDLRQALFYISHRFPEAPLLGLSFSLGANVMTRYVAEEGELSRLKSACILGCVRVSESLSSNCDNFISQGSLGICRRIPASKFNIFLTVCDPFTHHTTSGLYPRI